ncbi:conserved membrane protein of unknown function [Nitrospira japonica]|uniref:Uncharacterized protein n=1 Tax=Nitrospira japonica TaxID=1325564 RepID=A0A1W1I5X5_9BACT|nr:hypothetical protein [Nitrospira japonica]SLM48412.1 conserved membrane protein of unknown function [Nitrospira japonica]
MDTPAGKRRYLNPLGDAQDQYLFFGLFIVGAVGIWILKWSGYSQLIVTLFPVSLMLIYCIIALATKQYRIREDRAGDNVYYLGFLFTLVSLAFALHDYRLDGSGVEYILKDFGIAIFTTIFGLAGRVFFSQMREDPVEYEREARYALSEASSAMRTQLGDISTDVSSFKRKLVQIVEEGVVDITNSANAAMTETVEKHSAASIEIVKSVRETFQTFVDHSTELNDAAAKNVKALQSLFKRIEKIEAPSDMVVAKFDSVLAKFEEVAAEALKSSRTEAGQVSRLRDSIDAVVGAAETIKKSSELYETAMSQRIDKLKTAIEVLVETVASIQVSSLGLTKGLEEHQTVMSQSRSLIEDDLRVVRKHRDSITQIEGESRQSLQQLEASLVSLCKTLVEQLGGK